VADFSLKCHDRLPSIQATLLSGGVAVDLTGCTVKFIMANKTTGTVKVTGTAVLVTPASGVVRYDWLAVDTDTPGSYQAEWEVTNAGGKKQTFPTLTYHTIDILADLDNA
jgi:hypothetical protein